MIKEAVSFFLHRRIEYVIEPTGLYQKNKLMHTRRAICAAAENRKNQ